MTSPIRPTDQDARDLARQLLTTARFAALGVLVEGRPQVTRIAIGCDPEGRPMSLVSDLSAHTIALRENPVCSVLIGEPGTKGDPLTYPRISLQCEAKFVNHSDPAFKGLRDHYLASHPKAKLYIDFADFHFVRFDIEAAALNGGFGKAFELTPADFVF